MIKILLILANQVLAFPTCMGASSYYEKHTHNMLPQPTAPVVEWVTTPVFVHETANLRHGISQAFCAMISQFLVLFTMCSVIAVRQNGILNQLQNCTCAGG